MPRKKRTASLPMQVYFVRCEGYIKIGVSKDPKERLRTMKTGNPFELELIGYVQGDEQLESTLHVRFQDDHKRGEWFTETEDLLHLAQELSSQGQADRQESLKRAVSLLQVKSA